VIEIVYEITRALDVYRAFNLYHGGVHPANIFEINGVTKLGLPQFRTLEGQVLVRGRYMSYNPPDT
jgi:hypothetical protein